MAPTMRESTAYIVVAPKSWYSLSFRRILGRPPRYGAPEGTIVVAVTIRVSAAAFQPIRPEVTVTIPDTLVQHHVEVEAVTP